MGDQANVIAGRIRERITALGSNATTIARAMGASEGFLTDVLSGRKRAFNAEHLAALSAALDCDPEFIIGIQAAPRRAAGAERQIAGTIEPDVWRPPARDPWAGLVTFAAYDPRYRPEEQRLWRAQGDHSGAGWPSGALVTTVSIVRARPAPLGLHSGDIVVTERQSAALLCREARRVAMGTGIVLESLLPGVESTSHNAPGLTIVGLVVRLVVAFD